LQALQQQDTFEQADAGSLLRSFWRQFSVIIAVMNGMKFNNAKINIDILNIQFRGCGRVWREQLSKS